MPSLYLGARRIDYAVVRGTSMRYTYFRFRPDLTLEVILPRGRVVDVENALRDRSVWVQRQYEKLSNIRDVLADDSVMFDSTEIGTTMDEIIAFGTAVVISPVDGTQEFVRLS